MGVFELPEGYYEIQRIDLVKNKKLAVLVNVMAVVIMIVLFIIGVIFVPFNFLFSKDNLITVWLNVIGLLLAIILYIIAHEFIHGVFIKKYSCKKAKYGFNGLYAYTGSDAYFNKHQYVVIALAPVVLFGIIFLLLNVFLPIEWFWGIYILQIVNLSGAAGDFYITRLMCRLPSDVMTKDEGITMIIYSQMK